MRAVFPALLLAVPLLAGDRDPLAEAVEAFGSDHPARRDAGSQAVRGLLEERLAPLLEAMKSEDPEVSRRARESLESFLPPRPSRAEPQDAEGMGQVIVMNNRNQNGRVIVRVVQANGQRIRVINGRLEADDGFPRQKAFGVTGDAVTDRTLRRHLRLGEGRGFLVGGVEPGTTAARLGLLEDDIVLRIDDRPVMTPEDVEGALGEEKAQWKQRRFRILRAGELKDLPGE